LCSSECSGFCPSSPLLGPILHHVIEEQFVSEWLSNLTGSQRDAFVQGSLWADGFDKRTTHHTSLVVEKLRQINVAASDLHWFFVGNAEAMGNS
jgi:hypothetical protein